MFKRENYNYALRILLFFLLFFSISSCNEKEFLIIEDGKYYIPAYRIQDIIGKDTLYSLHKRFFVFNYETNTEKFDSLSIVLLCNAINDSVPLSICEFDFQKMPNYSPKYKSSQILTADWTTNIVYYKWDIKNPGEIYLERGKSPNRVRKTMALICK